MRPSKLQKLWFFLYAWKHLSSLNYPNSNTHRLCKMKENRKHKTLINSKLSTWYSICIHTACLSISWVCFTCFIMLPLLLYDCTTFNVPILFWYGVLCTVDVHLWAWWHEGSTMCARLLYCGEAMWKLFLAWCDAY